jgi:hypothetical protein
MSLTKTFIAALILSLCGQGLGAAVPNPSLDLTQRDVPADDISKYTVEVSQVPTGRTCHKLSSSSLKRSYFRTGVKYG